ncbi:DnaJ domain-containing protein [Leptodontidium sp. 2 PMI_412]|nr:DnaJ domain-containing protein [Leptodontidium sp. 2 PMI_412]
MPSRPDFDLYEALELTSAASATEITSNYRRLAREHHPDKNPDNVEATEKMQRINAAHEILSDTSLRAEYDSGPSTPESGSSSYFNTDENGYRWGFEDPFANEFPWSRSDGQQYGYNHSQNPEMDRMAAEEELRKQRRAEWEAKWAKEQAEKAAREEKKKKEEATQQAMKETLAKDEKDVQEQIWKSNGAVTAAEKRASCLHSHFWPRHQGKSKYKCMGCNQKRGPTGFRCPHCEVIHCQSCLNAFNAKRSAS